MRSRNLHFTYLFYLLFLTHFVVTDLMWSVVGQVILRICHLMSTPTRSWGGRIHVHQLLPFPLTSFKVIWNCFPRTVLLLCLILIIKYKHSFRSANLCNLLSSSSSNRIYTSPYGDNFRGAGGRSDQCSMKGWVTKVSSLNLKQAESRWSELFVAASSRQTVLKIGKHAWKSLSWWTVGPAAGWKMSVKFGYRHVPFDESYESKILDVYFRQGGYVFTLFVCLFVCLQDYAKTT